MEFLTGDGFGLEILQCSHGFSLLFNVVSTAANTINRPPQSLRSVNSAAPKTTEDKVANTISDSITSEEIRSSRAGRVVPPADPAALVRAVERIHEEWTAADALAGPGFVASMLSEDSAICAFATLLTDTAELGLHLTAHNEGTSVAA